MTKAAAGSRALATEEIAAFSARTNGPGLLWLCAHLAFIGAGAWLSWATLGTWAFVPALLLHSLIIGFLFSPLHECAHGTAFRSRWLNETALWIVAVLYIVPPLFFRYFHLGHHRYTQQPGKDPSLVLPEPASFRQYLWYCAGLWFWWRNLRWIARHAMGRADPATAAYVPAARRGALVTEARVLVALYAAVGAASWFTGTWAVLLVCWVLPRLLGEPAQRMLRVAEHVGCDESSDTYANTRTTHTTPLVNALAWMMPYHAEHHLYPNVPFHRLSALHQRIGNHVVVERRGYLRGQLDIIRWLRSPRARNAGDAAIPAPPGPVL